MKVRLQHVVRTIPLIGSLVEVVVVVEGGGGSGGGVSDPKRRKESAVARRGRGRGVNEAPPFLSKVRSLSPNNSSSPHSTALQRCCGNRTTPYASSHCTPQ